jgi:hypothetical protein
MSLRVTLLERRDNAALRAGKSRPSYQRCVGEVHSECGTSERGWHVLKRRRVRRLLRPPIRAAAMPDQGGDRDGRWST